MDSKTLSIFFFLSGMVLMWSASGNTTWPAPTLSSVFSAQTAGPYKADPYKADPYKVDQQQQTAGPQISPLVPEKLTDSPDVSIKAGGHTSQNTPRTLSNYAKAQEYFAKRQRPLRHFLDLGIGATLIESFYPFEMTAYPFSVYANYRREKWGQLKLPLVFSFQYAPLFNRHTPARIHTLAGIRYPASHDLKLFHIDFHLGVSFPLDFSFKIHKPALELRFLLTHIIGPKDSRHRLYFQWGPKAQLTKKRFRSGLIVHLGLDNHL